MNGFYYHCRVLCSHTVNILIYKHQIKVNFASSVLLKGQFTQKTTLFHYLSPQTCTSCSSAELKRREFEECWKRTVLAAIDFNIMEENMAINGNCSVSNIIQNIFF